MSEDTHQPLPLIAKKTPPETYIFVGNVKLPDTNTVARDTQLPKAGDLKVQTPESNAILQPKDSKGQLFQPISGIPRLSEVKHPKQECAPVNSGICTNPN